MGNEIKQQEHTQKNNKQTNLKIGTKMGGEGLKQKGTYIKRQQINKQGKIGTQIDSEGLNQKGTYIEMLEDRDKDGQ